MFENVRCQPQCISSPRLYSSSGLLSELTFPLFLMFPSIPSHLYLSFHSRFSSFLLSFSIFLLFLFFLPFSYFSLTFSPTSFYFFVFLHNFLLFPPLSCSSFFLVFPFFSPFLFILFLVFSFPFFHSPFTSLSLSPLSSLLYLFLFLFIPLPPLSSTVVLRRNG